ncbi:hypothetical protein [Micromonospora deserti]|nr:hypothetical protein [Micromonospora deserti]
MNCSRRALTAIAALVESQQVQQARPKPWAQRQAGARSAPGVS